MIERKRYNGFFGRVRANYLLEKGLKFGIDCHGVHLKSTISTEVRQMVRFHLNKPGIPQTKEEVFFALYQDSLIRTDAPKFEARGT